MRDVDALKQVAQGAGLSLVGTHAMPANNLLLVWQRGPGTEAPERGAPA